MKKTKAKTKTKARTSANSKESSKKQTNSTTKSRSRGTRSKNSGTKSTSKGGERKKSSTQKKQQPNSLTRSPVSKNSLPKRKTKARKNTSGKNAKATRTVARVAGIEGATSQNNSVVTPRSERKLDDVLPRCVRCEKRVAPNDKGEFETRCSYCDAVCCTCICKDVHVNLDCEDPHAPRIVDRKTCPTCEHDTTNLSACCYETGGNDPCETPVCDFCPGANMNTEHEMQHGTMCAEHTEKTK